MSTFLEYAIPTLFAIVIAILKVHLGKMAKTDNMYARNDTVDRFVGKAVNAVEQLSKCQPIADKFNEAATRTLSMLEEEGIYISEEELESCIESAVLEFNKYKSKEKVPEPEGAEVSDDVE